MSVKLYDEDVDRLPVAIEATASAVVPGVVDFEIVNVRPLIADITVGAETAYAALVEATVT